MRAKVSNAFIGLFFIIVAVLLAGNAVFDWDFSLFFKGWWTLFIIIPSLLSIVKSGFRISNSICLIVGTMLLVTNRFPQVFTWSLFRELVFPAVLFVIGINILFSQSFKNVADKIVGNNAKGPDYTAIFSTVKQQHIGEAFIGSNVTSIFGTVDLDLRHAIISQDVVIDVTSVFGGANIYLPANVKSKLSTVPIFGGATDKTIHPTDGNAPTVYINSVCVFGGVDVK